MVENDASPLRLVEYIQVDTVRAGIVPPEQVPGFRWSGLRGFAGRECFAGPEAGNWLWWAGLAADAKEWAASTQRLRELAVNPEEQEPQGLGAEVARAFSKKL